MATILGILDVVVVLLVVMNVSLAVWKDPSGTPQSLLLSLCVTTAVVILGIVSFLAAYGLTVDSPFNQWALLISLVASAVGTAMWRGKKAVR